MPFGGDTSGPAGAAVAAVHTVGHGTRPLAELIDTLRGAGVVTLVDVRRFPGSRRNPQFGQETLAGALPDAGLRYVHAPDLGGRRSTPAGDDRFACLRVAAFRSYATWMGEDAWGAALSAALDEPSPCLMCAETLWWRCHRRLIAELLVARGHDVVHLLGPGQSQPHKLLDVSEVRAGRLYVCGDLVA